MSSSSKPPASTLTELQPGEFVDRHQLLYPIARGGMGTVWLSRVRGHNGFEKHFVLKTVRPELAHDASLRTMFLDEIRITAAISHGNVAQVIDAGEARDVLYLVMEYIQGDSLSRLYKGYAKRHSDALLPPAITARVIVGACAGLHAAHELASPDGQSLQVVHRDVSPQNLLVSVHGATKVIDFGIATARERLAQETSLGMLKGKLRFMAPEQIARKGVDRRTDLWSLGCVLTLMLTGNGPFDDANEAAMLHRILSGDRTPLPPSIPRPLARVIDMCLSKNRDDRPENADVLGRLLEQAMRDAGLIASESDVAQIFAPMFKSSAVHADNAMKTALAAIGDRERVRLLLEPHHDSHSNLSPSIARVGGGVRLTASAQGWTPKPVSVPREPEGDVGPTEILHIPAVPSELWVEPSASTETGISRQLESLVPSTRARAPGRKTWTLVGAAALLSATSATAFVESKRPASPPAGASFARPLASEAALPSVASSPSQSTAVTSAFDPLAAATVDAGARAVADTPTTPSASARSVDKPKTVATAKINDSPKAPKPRPAPASDPDFTRRY